MSGGATGVVDVVFDWLDGLMCRGGQPVRQGRVVHGARMLPQGRCLDRGVLNIGLCGAGFKKNFRVCGPSENEPCPGRVEGAPPVPRPRPRGPASCQGARARWIPCPTSHRIPVSPDTVCMGWIRTLRQGFGVAALYGIWVVYDVGCDSGSFDSDETRVNDFMHRTYLLPVPPVSCRTVAPEIDTARYPYTSVGY